MKSYADFRNEALDDAIRYAEAAKKHPERATAYIAAARRALKTAAGIDKEANKC